eukprot:990274-Pyramimonas_sp.AAC.1
MAMDVLLLGSNVRVKGLPPCQRCAPAWPPDSVTGAFGTLQSAVRTSQRVRRQSTCPPCDASPYITV